MMLAAIVAFIFMFGTMSSSVFGGKDGYTVYAYLDDATGLAEETRVMMAGIPVGEISAIRLDGSRARISLRIRDDVTLMEGEERRDSEGRIVWVNGASIAKRQASLLGDYYIELAAGLDGRELGDGDRIHNVISPVTTDDLITQMNDLAGSLQRISADVEVVTGNMRTVLGDPETANRLNRILEDIEGTTSSLEEITQSNQDSLRNIVANVENISYNARDFTERSARSVDDILGDVRAVTSELRYIIGENSAEVQEGIGTLTGTMASLQLAIDNLNYSLANVQEITDRMVDGEGTVGRLLTDDTIARETERVVTSAADLIEPIARLQTWMELRSEYNFDQAAFKNYFRLSLRPNPNKFYILELIDDPRGATDTTLRTVVSTDPEDPGVRYEEVTETYNRFKVSILLGQRWAILPNDMLYIGGRFGILESSGGLGADIWAFNDALEIRTDIFDFGENSNPRLRTAAFLHGRMLFRESSILSNFFIQAGVDDVLNRDVRDYFIGAGIQFNDRDLRSIVAIAPTPSF